jgi:hypothetical protein
MPLDHDEVLHSSLMLCHPVESSGQNTLRRRVRFFLRFFEFLLESRG